MGIIRGALVTRHHARRSGRRGYDGAGNSDLSAITPGNFRMHEALVYFQHC